MTTTVYCILGLRVAMSKFTAKLVMQNKPVSLKRAVPLEHQYHQ